MTRWLTMLLLCLCLRAGAQVYSLSPWWQLTVQTINQNAAQLRLGITNWQPYINTTSNYLYTNIVNQIVGGSGVTTAQLLAATNNAILVASNFTYQISKNTTNYAFGLAGFNTNYSFQLAGFNTNYSFQLAGFNTNFAQTLSQNATSLVYQVGQANTNWTFNVGANDSNFVQAAVAFVLTNITPFNVQFKGNVTNSGTTTFASSIYITNVGSGTPVWLLSLDANNKVTTNSVNSLTNGFTSTTALNSATNLLALAPAITFTNFVLNKFYTNNSGRPILLQCNLQQTNRAAAAAELDLYIGGNVAVSAWNYFQTNVARLQSSAGATNSFTLFGLVTNTGTYIFTNLTSLNPPLLSPGQSWYIIY